MALYLVATPIGNLGDITLRALQILGSVPLIAAEDTRSARRLLAHHQIRTKVTSYHEQNKRTKLPYLLAQLAECDVALISEAGTPAISDPGYELVCAAASNGIAIVPVPGPSAVVTALSVSGLPTDQFVYVGFLPRRGADRRRLLESVSREKRTIVAYEAPHRLRESLADVLTTLGDRRVAVCRELTKLHEEIFRGSVAEALEYFSAPRGEIVLVLEGATRAEEITGPHLDERIRFGIASGLPPARMASELASELGLARRTVYARIVELSRTSGPSH